MRFTPPLFAKENELLRERLRKNLEVRKAELDMQRQESGKQAGPVFARRGTSVDVQEQAVLAKQPSRTVLPLSPEEHQSLQELSRVPEFMQRPTQSNDKNRCVGILFVRIHEARDLTAKGIS